MGITTQHIARPGWHIGHRARITYQSMVPIPQAKEIMLSGIDSCQTDSKIVGLTTTIAQVHGIKITPEFITQHFGIHRLHIAEIDLGDMAKGMGLLGDCLDEGGMGVADGDRGNSGDPVLVAVALVVKEVLHFALHHQQGLVVIVEVELWHIVFAVLDNLLEGDALVWFGLVVECREGHGEGLGECFADHHIKWFIFKIKWLRVWT